MRRRVALAVIVVVVLALVLTGIGTLVLSRAATRRSAETELRQQAAAVAELIATLGTGRDGSTPARVPAALLRRLSTSMQGRDGDGGDMGVVVIGPGGRTAGALPPGVDLTAEEQAEVRHGGEVSGSSPGGGLYAAAGRPLGRAVVVVGITGSTRALFSGAARWFAVSGALVVALAVAVALWLGGRLARPVRQATAVTERIAGGDLSARLPDPPDGDRDETAVLSRSVNAMADALERSRASEQQFLMSVSHDLRTPLTNIRGYAEAITDDAAAPHDAARVIQREAARLDRLVRDLLDLARLDARQFTLHPVAADLGAVVTEAAASHRAEVAAAGSTLDVRAERSLPTVVDVDRLAQVVDNLVGNAIRYAATTVVVSTDVEVLPDGTRWARTEVRDDGPGIDPADQPYVFERLYQGRDRPRRAESGSGLGLAIVRELVTAMGGTVGVASPAGGGTTFWFRLPLLPDPPPGAAASPPPPDPLPGH